MEKKNHSDIDLSKLPLIKSEISEYVPIEEFEKDLVIRIKKYPYVTHIKIEKYTYMQKNGLEAIKTITNKRIHGKKAEIKKRYESIKPFGLAKVTQSNQNPNDGITTLGAEVFIESPKTIKNKNKNNIFTKPNRKNVPSFSSAMKAFRPSMKNLEKFKNLKDFTSPIISSTSESGFTKNSFIPSGMKSKLAENMNLEKFSIVIKNIPAEEDIKQMEYSLKDMFKPFGEIERLKVLSDKFDRNLTRDIAFLDFVYPTDAEQLLASKERFTIGHNILNLEKSKSRK
jgi:hypothetical protein